MSAVFGAARILRRAARLLPAALEVDALLSPARLGWGGSPLARLRLGADGAGLLGLRLQPAVAAIIAGEGCAWLDTHAQQARGAGLALAYSSWRPLAGTTPLFWSETRCMSHALLLDVAQASVWLAWQGPRQAAPRT